MLVSLCSLNSFDESSMRSSNNMIENGLQDDSDIVRWGGSPVLDGTVTFPFITLIYLFL